MADIDANRVREAVERLRNRLNNDRPNLNYRLALCAPPIDPADLELLCTAAERAGELQRTMQMMDLGAEALGEERDAAQAELAAVREQAAHNAEMSALNCDAAREYAAERDQLRAERDRLQDSYAQDIRKLNEDNDDLRTRLTAAEGALRPFARVAEMQDGAERVTADELWGQISIQDCRAARAALANGEGEGGNEMKIEKLFAVVDVTPDYTLCDYLTTDRDAAEKDVWGSHTRRVYEIDLGDMLALLIKSGAAKER